MYFCSADVVTIWCGIIVFGDRTDVEDPTCLVIFFFPPRKTHFFVKEKYREKKEQRERESKEYDLKVTPKKENKKRAGRKGIPQNSNLGSCRNV